MNAALLTFLDTKNGEDRVVPVGQQALKTFQEMSRTPAGLVFVRANGEPIKDFRRAWLNALKAAGLGKHLFHGNRRSQAVNLMTAGVDEQTAMEITGHKDSQTFRGYRVLVEEAKRAAIAKRDSMMSSEIKPSSSRVADSAAEPANAGNTGK